MDSALLKIIVMPDTRKSYVKNNVFSPIKSRQLRLPLTTHKSTSKGLWKHLPVMGICLEFWLWEDEAMACTGPVVW